ncbi:MAG: hypothetical protein J0L69_05405 [Bacteroidetes bacterium]|nr:hypothetical protein [Bacteroidota bacterium]
MRIAYILCLLLALLGCKKNKTNTPKTYEVEGFVNQVYCTNMYYYNITTNNKPTLSTEIDFGDGSPVSNSNIGYHQYNSTGTFNFKVKQTFEDGGTAEKVYPISIGQISEFRKIGTTNYDMTQLNFNPKYDRMIKGSGKVKLMGDNLHADFDFTTKSLSNVMLLTGTTNGYYYWQNDNYIIGHKQGGAGSNLYRLLIDTINHTYLTPNGFSNLYTERYDEVRYAYKHKFYWGFGNKSNAPAPGFTYYKDLIVFDATNGAVTTTLSISSVFGSMDYNIKVFNQIAYNDKLYIFCAAAQEIPPYNGGYYVVILDLNTTTFTYHTVVGTSFIYYDTQALVVKDEIYLFGNGLDCIVYNPSTATFRTPQTDCSLTNLNSKIMLPYNNKLYCIGVYVKPKSATTSADKVDIWEYTP